jgi:serine/threonine protein kinase
MALQAARFGGTLPYMSPEQLEAFGEIRQQVIDARSDLFAIGVILFEMLTGTCSFPQAIGAIESNVAHDDCRPETGPISLRQRNAAVPKAVEAIVRKLLDPDPARRYQNAAQLREDLERQLADQPLKFAADRSATERFRKWRRRHPRLAAFSLAAAITTVLLIVPTTVVAVRQSQIAERAMQIETAEAKQLHKRNERKKPEWYRCSWPRKPAIARCSMKASIEARQFSRTTALGETWEWMNHPRFARLVSGATATAAVGFG